MRSFYIAGIYNNPEEQVKYNQENKRENKTAAKPRKLSTKNLETRQMQNRDDLVRNNKKGGER
jgi:hypothetical protein